MGKYNTNKQWMKYIINIPWVRTIYKRTHSF